MLTVEGLSAGYRRVGVLRDLSLEVGDGEIVAVLGPNGAGKSTLMKSISGMIRPTAGRIRWNGTSIERMSPHKVCRLGLSLVPEGRGIFTHLTVKENLQLAAGRRHKSAEYEDDLRTVFATFPIIEERQRAYGAQLSGGQQQMLAISRAMVQRPKLILLDEPSLGLSPLLTQQVLALLPTIAETLDASVLLVEQNASLALAVASRAYVLQQGAIAYSGPTEELSTSEVLLDAYLGGGDAAAPRALHETRDAR